ncbi:MAG: hypothetical protein CM15mP74_36930 [Halieaceae bacterium]|nr:MAG: hypothetical protein CM15mP74_36930 [Halieaceae bacterium]
MRSQGGMGPLFLVSPGVPGRYAPMVCRGPRQIFIPKRPMAFGRVALPETIAVVDFPARGLSTFCAPYRGGHFMCHVFHWDLW